TEAPSASPRQQQDIIDQAGRAMGRATALLAAQGEALNTLRATRAAHSRLRSQNGGRPARVNGHRPGAAPDELLTPRQREMLRYLAEGLNAAQIAERQWLSRATVRNHVAAILTRLECHSRIEAVGRARKLGLL